MPRNLTRIVGSALSCGLAWLVLAAPQAQAGFTVTLANTSDAGSNTQFNYTASVGGTDVINKGDSFQVVDFDGLVANSLVAPTGWTVTATTPLANPTPNVLLVNGNDPAIPDLTFTYNGDSPISGPVTVGGFSAVSVFGADAVTFKDFTGITSSPGVGRITSVGEVRVPTAGLISPSPAPEPASMVSAGIGLVFAGLYYRRRARKSA